MKKKQLYDLTEVDGLNTSDFPVVDILRKNNERIGCASVALLNAMELLNCREESEKRNELLLNFERDLQAVDGTVKIQTFLEFVDNFSRNRNMECISCYATKPNLTALLFLLVNGFCFLIHNASSEGGVGHLDVIWHDKENKKIYFNAWGINQKEFEELVYHEKSFLIGLRDIGNGRFVHFQKDIENFTIVLTDEQKVFLQSAEKLLLEKPVSDICSLPDFKNFSRDDITISKAELLQSIGELPKNRLIIMSNGGNLVQAHIIN